MTEDDRWVMNQAGCLTRGCNWKVIQPPDELSREIIHEDVTGAVSRLKYDLFSSRLAECPIGPSGHRLFAYVPDLIRRCHEFHEVADKMEAALQRA